MTPKQKKAAEFYAKASPQETMRRALRKYRVKLPAHDSGEDNQQQERPDTKDRN